MAVECDIICWCVNGEAMASASIAPKVEATMMRARSPWLLRSLGTISTLLIWANWSAAEPCVSAMMAMMTANPEGPPRWQTDPRDGRLVVLHIELAKLLA